MPVGYKALYDIGSLNNSTIVERKGYNNMNKSIKVTSSYQKDRPLLICVIADTTPDDCIATIRNAIYDGADGFMLSLGSLYKQFHTIDDIHSIIDYAGNRPVIAFNYRYGRADLNYYIGDEDLVNSLLIAARAGISMCDVMGDIFEMSPLELTYNQEIIEKQKRLVDEIHKIGTEVLMSSHTWVMMSAEQTIDHAKALASRGADMVKISMCAMTEDDLLETMQTTALMKRKLKLPYLHVCMGQYGKIHRVISGMLGSAMLLCVQRYTELGHKEQPLLRATRDVYNNLDWHNTKDTLIGTIQPPLSTGDE